MQINPPLLAITTFLGSNEVVNHVRYLGRPHKEEGRRQRQRKEKEVGDMGRVISKVGGQKREKD